MHLNFSTATQSNLTLPKLYQTSLDISIQNVWSSKEALLDSRRSKLVTHYTCLNINDPDSRRAQSIEEVYAAYVLVHFLVGFALDHNFVKWILLNLINNYFRVAGKLHRAEVTVRHYIPTLQFAITVRRYRSLLQSEVTVHQYSPTR